MFGESANVRLFRLVGTLRFMTGSQSKRASLQLKNNPNGDNESFTRSSQGQVRVKGQVRVNANKI